MAERSILIDDCVENSLDNVSLQTRKIVLIRPTILDLQQCAQLLTQEGRNVTHLEVKGFPFKGLYVSRYILYS